MHIVTAIFGGEASGIMKTVSSPDAWRSLGKGRGDGHLLWLLVVIRDYQWFCVVISGYT